MTANKCKCGNDPRVEVKHPSLSLGRRDTWFRVSCCKSTSWWYPKKAAVAAWNKKEVYRVQP